MGDWVLCVMLPEVASRQMELDESESMSGHLNV